MESKNKTKLNILVNEFNQMEIAKQFDFEKLYLYSIITHSTAIEGSTINEIENKLMFEQDIVPSGHSVTEQLMNIDLKNAYDYVLKIYPEKPIITIDLLKKISSLVMRNTGKKYSTILGDFDSSVGDLRKINVSAGRGGKSYLDFRKIPKKLEEFCDWINLKKREKYLTCADAYEFSFETHYNLVKIHPWSDGNGRVSRLLMNMIQMEQGLLPIIVRKEEKAEYIKSLETSQEISSIKPFIDFMTNITIKFFSENINEYKTTSQIDFKFDPLKFMKEVVKIHGTDGEILKEAIEVVTNTIDESTEFASKLMTDTLNTTEYKQAFEREQNKSKEQEASAFYSINSD